MQFTPSIMEKYAANLRELVTTRILKGKNIFKNTRLLKIILVFSVLHREEYKENISTKIFDKPLNAATTNLEKKGTALIYNLIGEEKYNIDYGLLKILIFELVSCPTKPQVKIKMIFIEDRIILTVQNARPSKILECLIKKQKGILIKEKALDNFAVALPAASGWDYEFLSEDSEDYLSPFSIVNIMLFQ